MSIDFYLVYTIYTILADVIQDRFGVMEILGCYEIILLLYELITIYTVYYVVIMLNISVLCYPMDGIRFGYTTLYTGNMHVSSLRYLCTCIMCST